MKKVYAAPDEFMALSVKSLLDEEGILSDIRRYENVWLDGLPKLMHGAWGEVLVAEDDFDDAKVLVDAFLNSNIDKQE